MSDSIVFFHNENDCTICFIPDRPMTAPSDVCQHYNKICRACKRALYEIDKKYCPYCRQNWDRQLKEEFYTEKIIEAFKDGLSTLYLCLTDEEANEKCREAIKEQLFDIDYALISEFFKEGCNLPRDIFEKLVSIMHEDANPILEMLITSTDDLCQSYIQLNGRGSLLADDDMEIPICICNKYLFLYANE